jgi:hypothetical protein
MTLRPYNIGMDQQKQPRKIRNIRATDEEWAAIMLLKVERWRKWAVKAARRLGKTPSRG